jgi:hypothetical protein
MLTHILPRQQLRDEETERNRADEIRGNHESNGEHEGAIVGWGDRLRGSLIGVTSMRRHPFHGCGPQRYVRTAERVLLALNVTSNPLLPALRNAPVDDETETNAEREAIDRVKRDFGER